MNTLENLYKNACEKYSELDVDVTKALEILNSTPISIHCWQADDVTGFETSSSGLSGGGIQATGNYPGKARNIQELRQDLEKVYSLIPGNHRLNLHAIYGDINGKGGLPSKFTNMAETGFYQLYEGNIRSHLVANVVKGSCCDCSCLH